MGEITRYSRAQRFIEEFNKDAVRLANEAMDEAAAKAGA